jgi:predicted RNA-binding protein with EMAP domain
MIADLIQQSKRFGHKAGEMYAMMIHDSEQIDNMGEHLHQKIVDYKDNLEFLLHAVEKISYARHGEIDQCIAWLRGEIKELENL